jgi:ketosteroid isomerase-like protein
VAKESRGRDAHVNNQFFKLVRRLTVKEMAVEGERAFVLVSYSLLSPKGKSFSSDEGEFWKVKNGKLDSVAIYFDTTAFKNFMTQ